MSTTTIIANHNPSLQGARIVRDEVTGRPVDVTLSPIVGFAIVDHESGHYSTTPIDVGGGHSGEIAALIDGGRWWLTDGGGSGFDPLKLKAALLAGDEDE